MQLNTNIKLIRELSGKKQTEFASLIGTKLSNLKTYETTDVRPKANILARIADIAGVSVKDLEERQLTHRNININIDKSKKNNKVVSRENIYNIAQDEALINSGTDQEKYIRILERDRLFFETTMRENLNLLAANLTELLRSQRYDRAQLTTLLAVSSRTLAVVEKRDVETVFAETNKAVNDLIAQQL